jgi:hypothetical protein
MYRKVTILFFILAVSATFAWGQTMYPHGQHDPTTPQDPVQKEKVLKVYPNPATTQISFEIQGNNDGSYEIIVYNFLGKRLNDIKDITNNRYTLPLDKFYSGIYIYQLRDKKGNLVESGKFNVIRQ